MGYEDEKVRRGQHRSRARRSEYTAGGRKIDYKIGEEPGKQDPGLDLITDHFKNDSDRTKHIRKEDIFRDPAKRKKEERRGKRQNRKKKRKIRIILAELVILLCVIGFAGYSYLTSRLDLMTRLPWDPDKIRNEDISLEKQEQMEGYWTIAIFGVDSRNSSLGSGNNSDVNLLCNIDQGTGEIKLVSVYRDTYLNINEKNTYNKINSAYLRGGPEQAVMALNKNLDLDIDEYTTFNWKAVADAINILGGIDLEITKAEFYYINAFITETVQATGVASTHLTQAGMNHLDGVQAVAYGRLRLMDSDYARTERQRKVIALAFEKMKKADWATVNNIIQTVFPQVSTSIEIGDLLSMGRMLTRYHITETMGFPSERKEVNLGKKGACVIPDTLESNVIELHHFLFGDEAYEPTTIVKSISAKILSDIAQPQETKAVDALKQTDSEETLRETETDSALEQAPEPEQESEPDRFGSAEESEMDSESDFEQESEQESDLDSEWEFESESASEPFDTDTGRILFPGSQIFFDTDR